MVFKYIRNITLHTSSTVFVPGPRKEDCKKVVSTTRDDAETDTGHLHWRDGSRGTYQQIMPSISHLTFPVTIQKTDLEQR